MRLRVVSVWRFGYEGNFETRKFEKVFVNCNCTFFEKNETIEFLGMK